MAFERLVITRMDGELARCAEVAIDTDALDQYAESVGVGDAILRRAKANGTAPQLVTANIHLGIREEPKPYGFRWRVLGYCNIHEASYGRMPPADTDIFLGSMIDQARDIGSSEERELYVSNALDLTLKHELIHFADPNLPPGRLKWSDRFAYPGSEMVEYDPQLTEKKRALRKATRELTVNSARLIIGNLAVSAATLAIEREYLSLYSDEIGAATFVATFFGGLFLTAGRLLDPSEDKLKELSGEVVRTEYALDPAEVHVRRKLETMPGGRISTVSLSSCALRHLQQI